MLGTSISMALSLIGITDDRVSRWLGRPCGCKERQIKLDQLHAWASRIMRGKVSNARRYLAEILQEAGV